MNMDEAVYKCANPLCLYPFKDFRFRSIKDKSVYFYQKSEHSTDATVPFETSDKIGYVEPASLITSNDWFPTQNNTDIEHFIDLNSDTSFLNSDAQPLDSLITPQFTATFEGSANATVINASAQTTANKIVGQDGVFELLDNIFDELGSNSQQTQNLNNEIVFMPQVPTTSATQNVASEAKLSKCFKHMESAKQKKQTKTRKNTMNESKKNSTANKSSTHATKLIVDTAKMPIKITPPAKTVYTQTNARPSALLEQINKHDFSQSKSLFMQEYAKTQNEDQTDNNKSENDPNTSCPSENVTSENSVKLECDKSIQFELDSSNGSNSSEFKGFAFPGESPPMKLMGSKLIIKSERKEAIVDTAKVGKKKAIKKSENKTLSRKPMVPSGKTPKKESKNVPNVSMETGITQEQKISISAFKIPKIKSEQQTEPPKMLKIQLEDIAMITKQEKEESETAMRPEHQNESGFNEGNTVFSLNLFYKKY